MRISKYIIIVFLVMGLSVPCLAKDLPTAKPERVGMSSERLARINSAMQRFVDDGELAGVVTMIARRGKVVHFEKFGKMDLEADKDMKLDTLFRIYSMSKPVTSVALMTLYEEGKFQLYDPVSKYLPQFKKTKVLVDGLEVKQEREFTIKNLLSHTAGFTYGYFGDTTVDRQYRDQKIMGKKNLEEMIDALAKIPLQYQPGTRWHYSVAVDVQGRLIEVLSGMPLDKFLKERIFTPLEMDDTFFEVPKEKIDRFGTNHRVDSKTGKLTVSDKPATSPFAKKVTFFAGGQGLVSTANDYMRFSQMLLNGGELQGVRILSPKTIELMTMNHLSERILNDSAYRENPSFNFGLGFGITADLPSSGVLGSVGNYYWGGAAGTVFWIDPKEELVVIGMIQLMNSEVPFSNTLKVLTYSAFIE